MKELTPREEYLQALDSIFKNRNIRVEDFMEAYLMDDSVKLKAMKDQKAKNDAAIAYFISEYDNAFDERARETIKAGIGRNSEAP